MTTGSNSSTSFSVTKDGVLECLEDGVLVQRVPSELLEGSELESFDWCNTCNHHTKFKLSFFDNVPRDNDDNFTTTEKIETWKEARARWRAFYNQRIGQTGMNHWFRLLGDLCGERCHSAIVLNITAKQQETYFKPASQLAENGAKAKRLFEDEAKELAEMLVQQQQEEEEKRNNASGISLSCPPPQGWFVRTSACSPKDAFEDGGSGPHHSLEAVLLALMASDRVHKTIRKHDYNGDDMVLYLMPFDPSIHIERELRVFVHENKVNAISRVAYLGP